MRRVFVLTGLLAVILMATWGGPTMVSASPCTETCSGGGTLSCSSPTGICSNAGVGSVSCCGVIHDCTASNTYNACWNGCDTAHDTCVNRCGTRAGTCLTDCNTALRTCWTRCGPAPVTNFSC